jgi:hypothetical protein
MPQLGDTIAVREVYEEYTNKICPQDGIGNLQNKFTPYQLCSELIEKTKQHIGDFSKKEFAVFNIEFAEVLIYDFGINISQIWFFTDCEEKSEFLAKVKRYTGINVKLINFCQFLKEKSEMKFDVVIMNPPYHELKPGNKKSKAIWPAFVKKALSLVKDDGFLSAIHPSGWRGTGKQTELVRKLLFSNNIKYVNINDESQGLKTFKVSTTYDWYVLQKQPSNCLTKVNDVNDVDYDINLKDLHIIPNSHLDLIEKFKAEEEEEKVEIIYSRSAYGSDKGNVFSEESEKFKYPVVYSTPVKGPTFWYSETNKNGHFGISKLILNPSRPLGYVIDEKGEYGMSQFCVGIVGDLEYLEKVGVVLKNQKTNGFSEFMESCHFTTHIFNKDVVSLFSKDFWNYFINQ